MQSTQTMSSHVQHYVQALPPKSSRLLPLSYVYYADYATVVDQTCMHIYIHTCVRTYVSFDIYAIINSTKPSHYKTHHIRFNTVFDSTLCDAVRRDAGIIESCVYTYIYIYIYIVGAKHDATRYWGHGPGITAGC